MSTRDAIDHIARPDQVGGGIRAGDPPVALVGQGPGTAANYPRPQLVRENWTCLDGPWQFAHDDLDAGRTSHWEIASEPFVRTIVVPFPPESPASGIHDPRPHRAIWYRRVLTSADRPTAAPEQSRLLLHFGAVDYRADVWVDGQHIATHEGGQTPFAIDITDALNSHGSEHVLVVRAEDDSQDVEQPRGKQDWQPEPHGIWYHRTSGIWQTVWLESVAPLHIADLAWRSDVRAGRVHLSVRLSRRPHNPVWCSVHLSHDGQMLASGAALLSDALGELTLAIPQLLNGHSCDTLLWSPDSPSLIDARLSLDDADHHLLDEASSYLGLRTVDIDRGRVLLNDRPFYTRAVLAQGYWPGTHLAAPGPDAFRDEVALIKSLGFNSVRVHQKVEDPRFLFWCDVLGLAVWAETAAAYQFSDIAIAQLTQEWLNTVRRDQSHPSIVAWVPFNESWGIQHVASNPSHSAFSRALADLTRALDPTRIVLSNEGWEHTASDLITVHDYSETGAEILETYGRPDSGVELLSGIGPAGRRIWVGAKSQPSPGALVPIILSEFGGISFDQGSSSGSWGYSTAQTPEEYEHRLADLFHAVLDCQSLQGFCYTQLTDTGQETNGLCDENRQPKIPAEAIHRIVVRGARRG